MDPEDRKEAYFLRVKLLITNYGAECLRELFNKEIPPSDLHRILQNHRAKINLLKTKKHVITNKQERLLYPSSKPPDSKDFDITLLLVLLRNICKLEINKVDMKLWEEDDNTKIGKSTTLLADVVRLRNIRNDMDHKPLAVLDETEFSEKWNLLTEIIDRIGKHCCKNDYKTKIDELKTRSVEVLTDNVRIMRQYTIDYLDEFKDTHEDFIVETESFCKAQEVLNKKHIVILTGHPGEGKTTMACKLALAKEHESRRCLLLKHPRDWRAVDWSLKIFDTIIIDDIFGAGSLDQTILAEWKPLMPEIEQAAKQKRLRVVITTRHYILEECRDELDRLPTFKTASEDGAVIHLTSKDLNQEIREEILKLQAKKYDRSLTEYILRDLVEASLNSVFIDPPERRENFAFGFPECASMFVRNHNLNEAGTDFFRKPAALFKGYLEDLYKGNRENRDKFLALVAVWASENNRISTKDLRNAAKASDHLKMVAMSYYGKELDESLLDKIKLSLESHKGGFLEFRDKTGEFMFNHNVIGDMVGVVLGKSKPDVAVELCQRDFLMEHVTLRKGQQDDEYMIVLKECEYEYLAEKCVRMILRDNCNNRMSLSSPVDFHNLQRQGPRANDVKVLNKIDFGIIKHDAFKEETFVKLFLKYVRENNVIRKLFSTPVMKMKGYFLDYGILVEQLEMCLAGYAFYSRVGVLARQIIEEGFLEENHIDRTTSLLLSTHAGDINTMRFLIQHGAKVTADVIYVAIHKSDTQSLTLLLQSRDADINGVGNIVNGNTPLMVAARKDKKDGVRCLLKHGVDPSLMNKKRMTALHLAVLYKRYDIIELLANSEHAPKNNKGGKFKRTPLHIAADLGDERSTEILLRHGADIKIKDHRGHYAIHLAAIRGHCDVVKRLLQHNKSQDMLRIASYGTKSVIKGMSLFHVAIWKDNKKLLKVLIDENANPNVKDFYGQTPLVYSILQGKEKFALKLVRMETVDKNMAQKQGFTPLHSAVFKEYIKVVKRLGPSVNANMTDKYGRTPLHVACEKANVDVICFLIKRCRADPGMVTNRGDTVFHILRRKQDENEENRVNRLAIEKYLNRFDPTLMERLSNVENRSKVAIPNRRRPLNPHDLVCVDDILRRVAQKLDREDDDNDDDVSNEEGERNLLNNEDFPPLSRNTVDCLSSGVRSMVLDDYDDDYDDDS